MSPPKKAGVLAKILTSALSVVIGLGIAEAILRYRNPSILHLWRGPYARDARKHPFRLQHPVYGHGLRPGARGQNVRRGEFRVSYRINSLGMRDREYPPGKPPGTLRILMLGDSYTEGFSVELEDTFLKMLERRLNADPPRRGTRYEVANLGVAGFSPLLEYLRLKELAPRLPGDLVVLNFGPTDFADDKFFEKGATFAPGGEPLRVRHTGLMPNYLSYSRHYLEALPGPPLRDVFVIRYLTWHLIRLSQDSWVKKRLGNPEYDTFGWSRPGNLFEKEWSDQFERTFGYILRIRDLAKKHRMRFMLVVYPSGHLVHPQAACHWRLRAYYKCGKVYQRPLIRRLIDRCAKAGLSCSDATPAFMRPDAPKLFLNSDGHFTKAGNAVLAKEEEKRLRPVLAAWAEEAVSAKRP